MNEAGGYDKAAKLYRKVAPKIKDRPLKASVYFKSGEAYRKSGNSQFADRSYDQAVRNKFDDPIVFFYGAQMALMNDNLDKAEKQLTSFLQLEPNNQQGLALEASLKLAREDIKKTSLYKIENVKEFNTRYHDFAPAFASSDYETIFFTSSRREGKKRNRAYEVTGQTNTDIYMSELTKKGWSKPAPVSDAINTEDEEGACVYNQSYTTLYYTQCRKERSEKLGCDILSIRLRDDDWEEPEELRLVADSLVAAHPALSSDGLTMYFTSNLPGGSGKLDLWKVIRGSDTDLLWSEPINLGSQINTAGDEMYPSVRKDTLYFASNGRVGYGGLDLYKAYQDKSTNWVVTNMGKPFNSNADDFAIIFENDHERGYFSSRRKGGKGGDDIYSFNLDIPVIEYSFTGFVRDVKTKARLAGAEVKLFGSDGSTLKRKIGNDGSFQFRLSSNTEYFATVTRQGYFTQRSAKINTTGLKESKTFTEDLLMTSFDAPIEIPNIFFEFGKADLSNESAAALDMLIGIMNENPSIVVELIAHTDNRGSDDVNRILSQRRAQAVIDYLVRRGVDEERMVALGLGESAPRVVTAEIAAKHTFLRTGQVLDERFINSLKTEEEKEICHALNRRTEIQVISDRYSPDY